MKKLEAGAAIIDVTPKKPMFLHGYPHVERISEGVHDPLYASALVIDNGFTQIGICAVDLIFISREITEQVREKVQMATGIPGQNLMVSASHTHSGPMTVSDIFYDPVVPQTNPEYVSTLVERLVQVYIEAFRNKKESQIAITTANGLGVGGNRRSKTDAVDPEVPVIILKESATDKVFALSTTYCMHPTILHEDSKLYSADFPGYTRSYVREYLGEEVILLYHTGPSGNQSPRHFIKSNSFDEAQRLGNLLGKRIVDQVRQLDQPSFKNWVSLSTGHSEVMLPKKKFMSVKDAEKKVISVKNRFEQMIRDKAPKQEIRTVECDWFGAEENRQLAEMAVNGKLDQVYQSLLPVEICIVDIDETHFVFLPGEMFVEYSLLIKAALPGKTYISSLSNGVLAGYIVTEEAEQEGGYEASNSIFPAKAGQVIVNNVLAMIENRNFQEIKR